MYFDQNFITFLKELRNHNTKDWFVSHKENFRDHVEPPFRTFVTDLITALKPHIPRLEVTAKDCIFRMNRDLRFSKDKTPYKTHVAAMISAGGRKDKTNPGAYIEISSVYLELRSGCFVLSPIQLHKLRSAIHRDVGAFTNLAGEKDFKSTFGEIQGQKSKRVPTPFDKLVNRQPLLANTNFHFGKRYPAEMITNKTLLEQLIGDFRKAARVNQFLREGIS